MPSEACLWGGPEGLMPFLFYEQNVDTLRDLKCKGSAVLVTLGDWADVRPSLSRPWAMGLWALPCHLLSY